MKTLSTEDIAILLGVTRAHVTNRIVKRPDFPAPSVNLSQRLKRWPADQVAKYLNSGNKK